MAYALQVDIDARPIAYAHPAPDGFADATLQPAQARWASSCSTGPTCARTLTITKPRSRSRSRCITDAQCADGIRRCSPAPRALRRRRAESAPAGTRSTRSRTRLTSTVSHRSLPIPSRGSHTGPSAWLDLDGVVTSELRRLCPHSATNGHVEFVS
jgi:hypothetical protein